MEFNTFTIREVAEKLQVSVKTIRRLIRDDSFIEPLSIGRQIRFVREDFYNWVEMQKNNSRKKYRTV